jgi:acetyl-CoA/propionyl-CoA carboxylase, biotin carboxylase, biotin carboxyl carrier protein
MIRRLLIANRGEIAVRVIRACREMGIASVAVFSDADAHAPHVLLADTAVRLGPPPAAESYLSIPAVLEAARRSGADAVHPGYGFLSEDARFADACARAGLIFVGPPANVIAQLGSKIAARELAARAGVPVVPGETPGEQSDAALTAAIGRVGLPVLLKPAAGGGGIGMKTVRDPAAIADAIAQARREAMAAFGDGTLYVERLVERPRHVEIQVLADHHAEVRHLFERECSLQRRHQKVIEEAPSPALTPGLRRRMGEAAVALARAAGYRNAGTVEFLLEGSGDDARFYFLEVNTRLQVEHPITEAVTGVDLVRAQIACAAGDPLTWPQEALTQRGHAFELRIYAEDPAAGDLPQAGRLLLYRAPSMPGIRVDSGVAEGDAVSVYYDPLLAKLVAWGESREIARRRALAALREFPILGVRTNVGLLAALLEHPRVAAGHLDTRLIEDEGDSLRAGLRPEAPPEVRAVAEAARTGAPVPSSGGLPVTPDPWTSLTGVRI